MAWYDDAPDLTPQEREKYRVAHEKWLRDAEARKRRAMAPGYERFPYRKTKDGQPLCRWCGRLVAPPKRTFCSNRCSKRYMRATSPYWERLRILHRDHGKCTLCRFNVAWLRHILNLAQDHHKDGWFDFNADLRAAGLIDGRGHLYEIDHIHPSILGGSNDDGNKRTLCIPCHKGVTRELQGELAKLRRLKAKAPKKKY